MNVYASEKITAVIRDSATDDIGYECTHAHRSLDRAIMCARSALAVIESQAGSTDIQLPEGWFRT